MKKYKQGARRLAVCLMILILLLASALSAAAASEKVESVQSQLAYLQRVSIDPGWLPDIRTNERAVQALLDGYLALSAAERAELTDQNNADLRAYFEALYEVQGRDVAEVAALFEAGSASSGASSSSSRSTASSSSASGSAASSESASGSEAASEAASDPASVVVPAPVQPQDEDPDASEVDSSTALPGVVNPPQTPKNEGWLALFGNATLGGILLAVLVLLAAVLFVRFLVALRRTGKQPGKQEEIETRTQELFGENYDPVDDPVDENFMPPAPTEREEGEVTDIPEALAEHPLDPVCEAGADEAANATEGSFAMFAPDNNPDGKKEGFLSRRKRKKQEKQQDGEAETQEAAELAQPDARGAETPEEVFATLEEVALQELSETGAGRFEKAVPTANGTTEQSAAQTEKTGGEVQPPFGTNPDRRNAITTRSFSAPPRTGRPSKMTFRQGEPDDLDAIDD